MSDTEDRERQTVEAITRGFERRVGTGVRNYVAAPAPGYDVEGLWHCFGAGHRSGYATHAIALHSMLETLKLSVQLVPHRNMHIDIEKFPPDRYDMLFAWHKNAVGSPYAVISSFPPEVSAELDGIGPPLIPYCAFEGTKVSAMCRDLCNGAAFAEIWTVSEFVARAMVRGGVLSSRVRTVRPPVCDGPWTMPHTEVLAAARQRPVTQDDPFVFGALGTWSRRKGFPDLLRAYFGAFKRSDPVKLYLHTSAFGPLTIRKLKAKVTQEIAAIAREFGDDSFPESQRQPRIEVDFGTDATDADVIEWLSGLDCYANATYGEGLGIPHIWAKASGVPMVSTRYGAVGDMLSQLYNDTTGASPVLSEHSPHTVIDDPRRSPYDRFYRHRLAPVDREMIKIALMFDTDSEWAVYEPADLGRAMRQQFEAGRVFDLAGALWTRQRFSTPHCLPSLREALRSVLPVKQVNAWRI